jgi:uncharacterized integral membrane protein
VKRLRWLITVPVALILIVLAVNNRHFVEVSLWPLDFFVRWPLFVFVYVGAIAGFLVGAAIAWTSAAQHHRRVRQRRLDKEAQAARAAQRTDDRMSNEGAGATPPAVID